MPILIDTADERLRRWIPSRIARGAVALVFLLSTTMQIVGVPFTSSFGTRTRIDLDVYRLGGQIWQAGSHLYSEGSMPFTSDGIWLPFTYPPFAALGFAGVGAMPLGLAGLVTSIVTVALTVLIVHIFLRVLGVGNTGNRWWIALLVTAGAVWLNPMWMTLGFGQINIILMAMIVVDVFVIGRFAGGRAAQAGGPGSGRATTTLGTAARATQGVLVGLAAAIKLTPLVFIGVFLVARRWRAALTALAAFVGAGLIAWVWLPQDSVTYWTHTLFHTGRIGDPAGRINQNLNALWIRVVGDGTTASVLWVLSALAATVLAASAVRAAHPVSAFAPGAGPTDRVNAVLVTCAIAVWGLLVSPTSWAHHWVWSIPIILTALIVAMRTSNRTQRIAYLSIAGSGIVIFAIGPFQLLSPAVRSWSIIEHVVGNAYSLWGIALLVIIWLLPVRADRVERAPDDTSVRPHYAATPP